MQIDNRLYLTCLWPGLPELWWRGRLMALPSAVAFGLALNVLLFARFIYPEWLGYSSVRVAGWVGMLAWFYCTVQNVRALPGLLQPRRTSDKPDRFTDAHLAYLRSDWVRAETLLKDCLSVEERDPPALLLLSGVYRHTSRFDLARQCVDLLRMTEAADRWWLEVDAEEKRLLRDLGFREEGSKVSDEKPAVSVSATDQRHSSMAA